MIGLIKERAGCTATPWARGLFYDGKPSFESNLSSKKEDLIDF